MRRIQFVPGAVGMGGNITIPTPAPDIDAVVAAEITRLPTALGVGDHPAVDVVASFGDHTQAQVAACFGNHTQAQVVAAFADHPQANVVAGVGNHTQAEVVGAIADHPDHAHDLLVAVGAAAEPYGASGVGVADLESITGQTVPGGLGTGGVQDNAAAQVHAAGAAAIVHAAGANVDHAVGIAVPHVGGADLAHIAGADLAHGAAADPVVAVAAVVKSTTRIVTFTAVNVLDGDLVTLVYQEVGEVVHAS